MSETGGIGKQRVPVAGWLASSIKLNISFFRTEGLGRSWKKLLLTTSLVNLCNDHY
jgi:hypothetical protein